MSTITSCALLSGGPAVRPANSSGGQVQSGRSAAVVPLSFRTRPRPLSVCCAVNPKGEHTPKTDLHPFNISPVVLVHPVPPREERWELKEEAGRVNLWFEVPGQSKEDLAVEIDEDVLVIKKKANVGSVDNMGQRTAGGGSAGQQTSTAAKEVTADRDVIYARMLLPAGYNIEGVEAELKSGVLKVSIAKIKEQARRRISVNIDVK